MVKATDKLNQGAGTDAGAVGDVTKQPAAAEVDERKPMPVPDGGWPADEYTGKGGDYVRDPFTGIRSPAVPAA